MGSQTKYLSLAIYLLGLIQKYGAPIKMAFSDGTEIDDFSDEALDGLKVKKMSDKRAEGD